LDTELITDEGEKFTLLDTAGIRRAGRTGRSLDYWATVRTSLAIERADICVLMIDALDGVTHQDLVIAGQILQAGKGIIIGINKFDLVYDKAHENDSDERDLDDVKMWGENLDEIRKRYLKYLQHKISFLAWAPVLFFSAQNKKGIKEILSTAQGIQKERLKRIKTSELNLALPDFYYGHVTSSVGTKLGKIKYLSQVANCPPKFIFFVNNRQAFHATYVKYLTNKIRDKYGFHGTPITIELRDQMDKFKGRK
jgi:GTP-binding protein